MMYDRGGPWDEKINHLLADRFGLEKFDPKKVTKSFEEKGLFFEMFRQALEDRQVKIITVAGTNGKGETARNIHRLLRKRNLNVALWTSPHVLSVRERFVFNEELIDQKLFETLLTKVPELSFYEGLFHIFCNWVTNLEKIDVIILEVGLGGRLDAVNFFDTDLVCLTSISRDHTEILGDSLTGILKEKLGVCRGDAPLISCLESSHLNGEIEKFSKERGIDWINLADSPMEIHQKPYWEQNMLSAVVADGCLEHGVENFDWKQKFEFDTPHESPGRFEKVTLKNRRFIFIGAHNLDGLRQLVQSVFKRLEISGDFDCLIGFSQRPQQDIESMLEVLLSCGRLKDHSQLCSFEHPRALSSNEIISLMEERESKGKENISFAENWFDQIQFNKEGTTLILGSYYFIGEVQKFLFHSTRP